MISKDKQYTTRDGREVRIYATDGAGTFPIHGAVLNQGVWEINTWRKDGRTYVPIDSIIDLIEIVPKVKVWVEYYLDRYGNFITARYFSEDTYLTYKAGGKICPTRTHLKLDVFEYEPKPETK
jgi:hypothetical protein